VIEVGAPADAVPSEAARGEAASWEDDTARPGEAAATGAEVLVVDDNADMRAYLTRLLAPHWAVRTTANGEEALAAVAERAPDVVLTDVMMPRVDGFELLRILRADPATRDIPVIMVTARAGQEASVEGLDAGADDYLAKPFRAPELIARVRVALERSAGRAAAPAADRAPAPSSTATPPVPRPRPESFAPMASRATPDGHEAEWRLPSATASIPVLRRGLRLLLSVAGIEEDRAYDVLLAACEAATNAIEHAQDPTEPYVDVAARVSDREIRVSVRDYGQWRERMPSMDRGRGGTLMSAVGDIVAMPSPQGTTVVITSPLSPGQSTG
jgi:CheY-like chemotaxis protein/anti-sigma regulatory factor (Ser/Thr protein kinase)